MKKFRLAVILILLCLFSITAPAVVLEQAPSDGGDGSLSVGPSGVQIATDDFQFSNTVQLSNISWWGSYDPAVPATESFTVRLFAEDGFGNPEINAFLETTFSGNGDSSGGLVDVAGSTVFQYNLGVNQVLQGGVNYYLSVFSNDGAQDWFWLESATGNGTGWERQADGDVWGFNPSTFNMSFQLTADAVVSAPVTLLLMILPMLWLGRLVRREAR